MPHAARPLWPWLIFDVRRKDARRTLQRKMPVWSWRVDLWHHSRWLRGSHVVRIDCPRAQPLTSRAGRFSLEPLFSARWMPRPPRTHTFARCCRDRIEGLLLNRTILSLSVRIARSEVRRESAPPCSHGLSTPNKAPEPTSTSVMPRATLPLSEMKLQTELPNEARATPAVAVAHL